MSSLCCDNVQNRWLKYSFYNEINHNQISSQQNEDGPCFQVEKTKVH